MAIRFLTFGFMEIPSITLSFELFPIKILTWLGFEFMFHFKHYKFYS